MKLTENQKKGLVAIIALDLADIEKRAAYDYEAHYLWNDFALEPDATQARLQYRRYLALRLLHPTQMITPTGKHQEMVDALWHAHILDTRRYMADCQAIYGEYLHHTPDIEPDGTAAALYQCTFTASLWGTPDPAILPLMYDDTDVAELGAAEGRSGGMDCA